ncbi:methylglyoxal synthase [Parvularcula flava]|uniref:Methylglyoxal synthase n=1 Tax=Aquisalinus luteolus TaxID=1566827 RepID=A0A8J3ERG6_9PROT|nr:methylglyoxal synthase [Aquisalinus luteolus]NHK28523.1 methylglyoxal synthase [Aquisalinus luteolus]GGH98733.1 methylglyoxal synthase [Aquisalinus luteolus]
MPAAKKTIALIAHDKKKAEMVTFAKRHEGALSAFTIVATGTTGGLLAEACPALTIKPVKSGPLGGDQQIGAMIAEGRVQTMIFFMDPLSPMPHDVDVKALTRLGSVYDIPMALNKATAEVILKAITAEAAATEKAEA